MEQQIKDTLYTKTMELLDMWPAENRQRSMHHFMEGLPLTWGGMFGLNGSTCLVASGYMNLDDWYGTALAPGYNQATWHSIMHAFDSAALYIGIEEARSVVIQAMKDWLSANQPDDVWPPMKELVAA